ncbi:ribosome biogenesis GTP-binding protein YihA/YsxC [Desulfogranum japonicum]|uniref:ribosome biogenesis GTP-binding protein YihA/YsxC n=1 Tax=Desulfogranum japonicum TaxID=231447 RepID=UPI00042956B2|nr:ribosome biogenesis GTP-binding protein YihA/YsxC [Desulfogranum japonicum]
MATIHFNSVAFLDAVHSLKQLPPDIIPDIAFAGRSNVGKSSLINRLVNRSNLVKTSAKPGKTRSLNFFSVDNSLYLVDLPGYGYAKVSRDMQNTWQRLISNYVETRESLALVVVIVDLRHEVKKLDRDLVDWLKYLGVPHLLVYTKADKLPRNKQIKNAASLDAGFNIHATERILFSSKSGQGCTELKEILTRVVEGFSSKHQE